jgi:hypothetical protein
VLTPHAPRFSADALVDSLSEGRIERGLIQTGQLSAELGAFHHTGHIEREALLTLATSFYRTGSTIEKSPNKNQNASLRKFSHETSVPERNCGEFHSGKVKRK